MLDIGERELVEGLRRGSRALEVEAPPGRVAVKRESVLIELGVGREDSAELDGLYEQIGVDLLASERDDPATLLYLCPARFFG